MAKPSRAPAQDLGERSKARGDEQTRRSSGERFRAEKSEREGENGSKRIPTSTRNSGRARIREGSDETAVRRRLRAPSSTMARLRLGLGFCERKKAAASMEVKGGTGGAFYRLC